MNATRRPWTLAQARALWWQKQALGDAVRTGSIAAVIGGSGWLRTLGGADVYLAARARRPGLTRAELDAAVETGELCVVPAARGCIYLVPAVVVGALRAGNATHWRKSAERDSAKAGSSMEVVEAVTKRVLDALVQPMTPDALRKALPAGSIPSFGEAGKKAGISSPLPLALRMLELDGRVERVLEGGRLDTERYQWRRAKPAVRAKPPGDPLDAMIGAFLDFAGPTTPAQLAAWSGARYGICRRCSRGSAPWRSPSRGSATRGWRRGEVAAQAHTAAPRGLALLAFEDNYLANHGLGAVADPRHHAIELDLWGSSKPQSIGTASHVLSRTIVVDGLIAGFWEVDPRTNGAVWTTFDPAPKALARQLDDATADTARFLLDQLGHARAYSLDTMDGVQQRADGIAKLRDGKVPKAKAKASPKTEPKPKRP